MSTTPCSGRARSVARHAIPAAAILLPGAFFGSVLSPDATEPDTLIYLAYVGAVSLIVGVLTLGIGLVRRTAKADDNRATRRLTGAP